MKFLPLDYLQSIRGDFEFSYNNFFFWVCNIHKN